MPPRPRRLWTPHATPLLFIRLTLWSFIALLVTTTLADPDLWGHLRFGLDMLAAKSVHRSDPYSFTADRSWINHEWLAELLMGAAYQALGVVGLGLLKVAVIAVIGVTLFALVTDLGARPVSRDLFVAVTLFVTYSRTQVVRPQLFSVGMLAVLFWVLKRVDRGDTRWLCAVPICFAVWANLHGAWIIGLAVLGIWTVWEIWEHGIGRRSTMAAAIAVVSVLATLLNPYGYRLWQFLADTVRLSRADVTEWKPLIELPPAVLVVEAILPAIALIACWTARTEWRARVRNLAIIAVLTAATLRVGRIDAFLQAAIAFLLAPPIVMLFNRIDLGVPSLMRRASLPVGALAGLLAAYVAVSAAANLRVVRVEGHWIPDPDAAMSLRAERPGAKILTWFDWGEYALWQLSPAGIRVSMDGRRETVYSERVIDDHMRFYAGRPDMLDYPDRMGADLIWLPSHLPIVEPLEQNGWSRVLDTGKSVVLARAGAPIAYRAASASRSDGFPWP